MYFLANEHETPVQPIDEEEFTKLQKRRNSFSLHRKTEYLRKTPAHATAEQCVPKTTIVIHCLAPQKSRVKTCSISSKTEG
jgi:hypothetical protein